MVKNAKEVAEKQKAKNPMDGASLLPGSTIMPATQTKSKTVEDPIKHNTPNAVNMQASKKLTSASAPAQTPNNKATMQVSSSKQKIVLN